MSHEQPIKLKRLKTFVYVEPAMMRLVCLLLISFAMDSNAIAAVKSNQKKQNTGENLMIESLLRTM